MPMRPRRFLQLLVYFGYSKYRLELALTIEEILREAAESVSVPYGKGIKL